MTDRRSQRRRVVVPPSRRRRSAFRRVVYSLGLLMGCFALAVFGLGLYGYVKFTQPGPLAADKAFQVERGGGVLGIAAELEKAGIISSANIFALAAHDTAKVLARRDAKTLTLRKTGEGVEAEIDVANTSAGRDVLCLVGRRDLRS